MRGIDKVLRFLQDNPSDWWYGRDIAKHAGVARSGVYIYLSTLEDQGKVQRRLEPQACSPECMRRTQYRITREGLREPVGIAGLSGAPA